MIVLPRQARDKHRESTQRIGVSLLSQERLLALGGWLKTNGDAIYGTRPWRAQKERNASVYYTVPKASFGKVYALLLDWPADGKLELDLPDVTARPTAQLLGSGAAIQVAPRAGNVGITLTLPATVERKVLLQPAWAFELTGVQ
jgi:alpha-L-fucosidase|eukprot:COSAG06_NODE_7108_length_2608_cov_11.763636_4_plen_144_part_00